MADLILVMGGAGTGKSTIARQLSAELRACLLDSDELTEALFPADRDSAAYLTMRPRLYRALYRLAAANLARGRDVVIDAPHAGQLADPGWPGEVEALVREAGARLRVVMCLADAATRRERMTVRGEARDQPKLARWDAFIAAEPDWRAVPLPHLAIDTSVGMDEAIATALALVREGDPDADPRRSGQAQRDPATRVPSPVGSRPAEVAGLDPTYARVAAPVLENGLVSGAGSPLMTGSRSLLLVIDFQARLMPAIAGGGEALGNAVRLVTAAKLLDVPVVLTEQNAKGLGSTAPELATICPAPVHKMTFGSCATPAFLDAIGERPEIIVAGCETHVCVLQTVLGLIERGRRVVLVRDAVGSRRAESKETALARAARHGAEIVTTEMVIFEWLRSCEHPRFRQALGLVR